MIFQAAASGVELVILEMPPAAFAGVCLVLSPGTYLCLGLIGVPRLGVINIAIAMSRCIGRIHLKDGCLMAGLVVVVSTIIQVHFS